MMIEFLFLGAKSAKRASGSLSLRRATSYRSYWWAPIALSKLTHHKLRQPPNMGSVRWPRLVGQLGGLFK